VNNLPNRSDKIYKEIENFEDYELTQCIAYEMAVRNPLNIEKIDLVVWYYQKNKEALEYAFLREKQDEVYEGNSIYTFDDIKAFENNKFLFQIEILEIDILPIVKRDYKYFTTSTYKDDRFNSDIYKIIDLITEGEERYMLNTEHQEKDNGLDKLHIKEEYSYRKGYTLITRIQRVAYDLDILEESDTPSIKETFKEDKTELDTYNMIKSNFQRPKIKVDKFYSNNVKLEIDLNRPLNEIVAYITHIKEDIDTNKNILKAPIELLGVELREADNISKMCIRNKNNKTLCFDGRKGITQKQKLADMFYIYDMVKKGHKELKIRSAISENEFNKKTDISDATFRKYRDISIDYIDNERYKELVTGVKSAN